MWRDQTDIIFGAIGELQEQAIDPDQAAVVSETCRQAIYQLGQFKKSVDTMLKTEMADVYRMLTPVMDVEMFAMLVNGKAVKAYPGRIRDMLD